MTLIVTVVCALLLDKIFAEPARFHPLVMFGNFADKLEQRLNKNSYKRWCGLLALGLAIVPLTLVIIAIDALCAQHIVVHSIFSSIV